MDAIICDYNYVFDPNAHLNRFFSEGKKGEYLFLIDEAHNLVERGRDVYKRQVRYMHELIDSDIDEDALTQKTTYFKSVGMGLFDVCIAQMCIRDSDRNYRTKENGL